VLQDHLQQRPQLLLPLLMRLYHLEQQVLGPKQQQQQQQQQGQQLLSAFNHELLSWIPQHIVVVLQQQVQQRLPLPHSQYRQQQQQQQQYGRNKQQQQRQGEAVQPPAWQAQVSQLRGGVLHFNRIAWAGKCLLVYSDLVLVPGPWS
jgi:AICAR transformylase/IMP cyclohydrolase PurH